MQNSIGDNNDYPWGFDNNSSSQQENNLTKLLKFKELCIPTNIISNISVSSSMSSISFSPISVSSIVADSEYISNYVPRSDGKFKDSLNDYLSQCDNVAEISDHTTLSEYEEEPMKCITQSTNKDSNGLCLKCADFPMIKPNSPYFITQPFSINDNSIDKSNYQTNSISSTASDSYDIFSQSSQHSIGKYKMLPNSHYNVDDDLTDSDITCIENKEIKVIWKV